MHSSYDLHGVKTVELHTLDEGNGRWVSFTFRGGDGDEEAADLTLFPGEHSLVNLLTKLESACAHARATLLRKKNEVEDSSPFAQPRQVVVDGLAFPMISQPQFVRIPAQSNSTTPTTDVFKMGKP